ncbi:hypothetical protein GCM10010439_34370 [Actinocorallia aurantiaca]|uniref:Uncharacterized protein n=1 Tax=Actinocorallia aurantiaca TaxID=46204 RepID=A0ABN3UAH2_9ACTN
MGARVSGGAIARRPVVTEAAAIKHVGPIPTKPDLTADVQEPSAIPQSPQPSRMSGKCYPDVPQGEP